ncbi:MAG TPA: hypothetical protein VM754_01475 [Actinomycetota bacterium]|nr:hypothetical protein [Actinomycetota bacterium]
MSKQAESSMTWVKAIILSTIITGLLFIFLGFLPSMFRYGWDNRAEDIAGVINTVTGIEFQDPYTLVRIHDAVSMGLQTFIFAIPIAATYILGERRRRRLGLRGSEGVKGYLPGK